MLRNWILAVCAMVLPVAQASAQDSFFAANESSSTFFPNQSSGSACGGAGCGDGCGPIFLEKYVGVFGGFADIDNFDRTVMSGTNRDISGAKLHDGWAGGIALGGRVHPCLRGEFEFTYRENSVESWFDQRFNASGVLTINNSAPATGQLNGYSGMFNFLFDCQPRCIGRPAVYLGGGIGSLYVDGDFATATNAYSTNDASFAYQFIGGINYPVSDRFDLFTEYRYLGADHVSVFNTTTNVSMGDLGYDSHNVFFGARMRF